MIRQVLISKSYNPYFNLALEEYFVRNSDFSQKQILLIYRNNPSIILGKNQNIYKEVHIDYILNETIPIARRISGGGTVVHDLGNINFSFFNPYHLKQVNSYQHSTGLMVDYINQLGVLCEMNERNAIILYNDKKISGSAQFSCSNGILSHFSLLYDSDLNRIEEAIKKNNFKIESKASASVRSKIDNLSQHLTLSKEAFIQEIIGFWDATLIDFIDESTYEAVDELVTNKYSSTSFIYDTAGAATLIFENGYIELEQGKIKNTSFDITAEQYIGKRLNYSEIEKDDIFWKHLNDTK